MHKQGELTSKDTGLQSTYLTILSMYFHVLYQSNNYQFFLFHVSPTLPRGRVIDEEISRAFQQLECEDIHWDSVFYEVNPAVWQQPKNKVFTSQITWLNPVHKEQILNKLCVLLHK